ncbi:MAG: hypothetical protein JWR89_4145 [Tardiphaga sp.]|uniref:hypothetical protein n=1 Tax=Tardiphaga sp. TaxID=1926292 RepID=UPI00262A5659|nr:hypothetical protein [Tardiphaga sp.]MDB5504243.1 hypothetical protein [Tardiphaga sp.]
MSDILKMDEPLAAQPARSNAAALRPATMKWAIWGTLLYAIPALGMIGYALWVAAHLGK